jgi:hypothetical protein
MIILIPVDVTAHHIVKDFWHSCVCWNCIMAWDVFSWSCDWLLQWEKNLIPDFCVQEISWMCLKVLVVHIVRKLTVIIYVVLNFQEICYTWPFRSYLYWDLCIYLVKLSNYMSVGVYNVLEYKSVLCDSAGFLRWSPTWIHKSQIFCTLSRSVSLGTEIC